MNQPRNTYTPGEPLPAELYAVGRPVTFFHAGLIEAGTITKANADSYDVRVISGGTFRNVRLSTLMNPQPNTFVFNP